LSDSETPHPKQHPVKIGPFKFIRAGSYEPDPNRKRYLIDQWWAYDSIGLIVSDPKLGKTWYALHMAFAVSSGKPFLGQFEVFETGPVIMFSPEGSRDEFYERVNQVGKRMGLNPQDLPLFFLDDVPGICLDDPEHQKYLEEAIAFFKPIMVICDPLEKCMTGGFLRDEEVKPMTDYSARIRREYGCSFAITHHTNSSHAKYEHERIKGAGLLFSYGDSYNFLKESGDCVAVTAQFKNAEKPEPMLIALDKCNDALGFDVVDAGSVESGKKLELEERILRFLADNHTKSWPLYKIRKSVKGDSAKYDTLLGKLRKYGEAKLLEKGWKIQAKGKKRALDSGLVEPDHFESKIKKKTVKKTEEKQG